MTTWRIGRQRLLKLAEHLEKGQLGHEKFDFANFNGGKYDGQVRSYKCGSCGCGIGECPILFKRDWVFGKRALPVLRRYRDEARSFLRKGTHISIASAAEFFAIPIHHTEHLFLPDEFRVWASGGTLTESATAAQVARSIREFVAWNDNVLTEVQP